jgi:hypothetical protein
MAGAQEGRHLWADDVEEDELEEARDQQRRGAASPLQASGGRGGGGTNAKDAGVSSSRGSRSTVREELAEEAGYPRFEPRDGWHEGLEVERGASRQRLDLRHGFVREIVRLGPLALAAHPSLQLMRANTFPSACSTCFHRKGASPVQRALPLPERIAPLPPGAQPARPRRV